MSPHIVNFFFDFSVVGKPTSAEPDPSVKGYDGYELAKADSKAVVSGEGVKSPIIEKAGEVSKDYKTIKGVALYETVSRNGNKYIVSEYENSVNTLRGKNISISHTSKGATVVDNVGYITNAYCDEGVVYYDANIWNTNTHPDVIEMIDNKLIQFVSIEAGCESIKRVKEEGMTVNELYGIEFYGLAFVTVPGVAEARVGLAESFEKLMEGDKMVEETIEDKYKKLEEENEKLRTSLAEKTVNEEAKDKETTKEESVVEKKEVPAVKAAPANEALLAKVEELTKQVTELSSRGIGVVEAAQVKVKENKDDVFVSNGSFTVKSMF